MIEEGGKALAAYMKPREEGKIKERTGRRRHRRGQDARPGRGILAVRSAARASNCRRASAAPISICGPARSSAWPASRPPAVVAPDPKDKRFADPEWSQNQFFDFLKQAYLLTAQWADRLVKDADGLDEHTRQKAEFYVKQIANAISPSNFVLTNPELLRETLSSNAENLVRGMHMLAEDIEAGHGDLKIRQSDPRMFEVGRNLALTPGKVIFQNDLMQLIQYEATTNRGAQGAAADRAALDQQVLHPRSHAGEILHQMVRRPGHHRVRDLLGQSGRAARRQRASRNTCAKACSPRSTPSRRRPARSKVNAIGYCVGGTLLAITLAYMAAKKDDRVLSATLFAAQVDFTYAGDLKVFVDEERIKQLEAHMKEQGYLEASRMANAFNMLRSNDLIWPYVINNYLRGKKPFPFDILYWNSDATRMPAANHSFYLRNCYLDNKLTKGEMEIAGVKLDLRKVKVPIYNLATREDHIAPAKSVLFGSQYFGGPVKFVLAGSGHIAGVVNPPGKPKYQYWTGGKPSGADLDAWLATAHGASRLVVAGLARMAQEHRAPRRCRRARSAAASSKPIEDAPGSLRESPSSWTLAARASPALSGSARRWPPPAAACRRGC